MQPNLTTLRCYQGKNKYVLLNLNSMKKVFIIQKFNLKYGYVSVHHYCFESESDALHAVDELKHISSETEMINIEDIDKYYVFNVLPIEILK